MFVVNKYSKIYFDIVKKASNENRNKKRFYYENHHIIPKCMGGTNDKDNLILLTAKEHFICHALLCKMVNRKTTEWNKLVHAFIAMGQRSPHQTRYFNARTYALAKKEIGTVMSQLQSGSLNSQYGTVWISHLETQKTLKVKKDVLQKFLENGYIKGRILDFAVYQSKLNFTRNYQVSQIDNKIKFFQSKIDKLLTKKIELLNATL